VADGDKPRGPVIDGPDADGFYGATFDGSGHNASYGRILCRPESERRARVRIATGQRASNVRGTLHGGFLLSFLDQALFIGPAILSGAPVGSAVTLSLSTNFVAGGAIDRPVDCLVEIVRETGRLIFQTGTMEQDGATLLTFQATLRKSSPRPA
jgi:acyl-coenzyme A thioesterase PaaI-like protein